MILTLTGTEAFINEILETVSSELIISKIERDNFRYTGIHVKTIEDDKEIEMKDYVDSLEEVKEIRKAVRDDTLTKTELKVFRKMTGKLSWLANSTHPDLSYTALAMSKKNNSTQIKDLRDITRVINKAKERPSKIKFSKIAPKDGLMVVGIGDASFKSDYKVIGGVLLFPANEEMTKATLIYWKSKTIARVCYSSKDAIFTACQIETMYYGDHKRRIKVRLFTDSEPTLESIVSSRQVERKTLRPTILDLKERLIDKDIQSYSWLPTQDMLADVLTKEMRIPQALEDVILKNEINLSQPLVNEVKAEIRMVNIRNR